MSETRSSNAALLLPTETERKQIFFWLKQISSHAAWNRILSFYKAWADTTEHSRRLASERGVESTSLISESDYVFILNGLAHCEEGVRRLRSGDKRVFKFDVNGEFAMADRALGHWDTYLWRIETGEHPPINEKNTPGWGRFHSALTDLIEVWREIAPNVLEPRYLDADSRTFCNDFLRATLERMTFPDPLPNVPDPEISTLVRSRRAIPCSGIWEPVDAPKPKLFRLSRQIETPAGPFPTIGTMSYLHGGASAPNMAAHAEENGLPATWRLLWEDTRYNDATVPDEEANYVFLKPNRKIRNQSSPTSRTT
ncbi:Imm71 family immunity protein [Cupriavidus necator]|uniref:Imm71 family immunity protein n=1 Tax=Cupriavidus necator TaxID=106590 RepID=UPI00339D7F2D